MFLSVISSGSKLPPYIKLREFTRLRMVESQKDGMLVRESQYVVEDVAKDNKDLHVQDFSLSNLQAIGATDMLKPITLSECNDFNYCDSFETKTLDSYVQKPKEP